jgi:hypothetical protein
MSHLRSYLVGGFDNRCCRRYRGNILCAFLLIPFQPQVYLVPPVQNRSEDVTYLVFWLYNTTILLHLLECDNSINEACEMLGSFEHLEEVINTVTGTLTLSRLL